MNDWCNNLRLARKLAALPVNCSTPVVAFAVALLPALLVTVVPAPPGPNALIIAPPNPSLVHGDPPERAIVLLPTTKAVPAAASETGVDKIVTAGPPGERVWLPTTNWEKGFAVMVWENSVILAGVAGVGAVSDGLMLP